MTTREQRRELFNRIQRVKREDPSAFVRQANTPEALALQAYRSSRIEGCEVDYEDLIEAAGGK
jgi:hypothetical protein